MAISNNDITISEFIFHVVHHGEEDPILLDETSIKGFETFFKDRIREILSGNKFFFEEDSAFLESLKSIESKEKSFLEISKELATAFHSIKDNRIKPGVMILIKCTINTENRYILIKYDHEEVIYYTQINKKAILKEISNTFSKNKTALQKSVIIELSNHDSTAIVIDKSELSNITAFFKAFLGVRRVYNSDIMTTKVQESYIQTAKAFKNLLPKEYTRQLPTNFYNLTKSMDNFEEEGFLKQAFGMYYSPQMDLTFKRELKRQDILGESFPLDKKIPEPKQKKFRTEEGVIIQFTKEAEDTVKIVDQENETIITITTSKLFRNE